MSEQQSTVENVRTHVGEGIRLGAGAIVGEAREPLAVDQPEVVLDDLPARLGEGTEPGLVSVRAGPESLNVRVGLSGVILGVLSGGFDDLLLGPRAGRVADPLVVGPGDGEVAGEPDLGNILNSGANILGGAISVDVGEQVRRLDGVVSSARSSKVVRSRD